MVPAEQKNGARSVIRYRSLFSCMRTCACVHARRKEGVLYTGVRAWTRLRIPNVCSAFVYHSSCSWLFSGFCLSQSLIIASPTLQIAVLRLFYANTYRCVTQFSRNRVQQTTQYLISSYWVRAMHQKLDQPQQRTYFKT